MYVLQHPGLNSEDIKIITVPVSDSTFVDFITGGPDVEYDRSPLLGAYNSHNKPMQRHFYRLVYFKKFSPRKRPVPVYMSLLY